MRFSAKFVIACSATLVPVVSAEVTYTKDIAPLFFAKCAECHRPNQVAPMSLLNYQETRPWAKSVKEKVAKKEMPPWFEVGDLHRFKGDPRLTAGEIKMVVDWVDAGAPKGNPEYMPETPTFDEGWKLGEPDLVLELDTLSIETGQDDTLSNVVVPFSIDSDKYVTAVEMLPEPSNVVHHIILFLGDDRDGRQTSVMNWLSGWAPGTAPFELPTGAGRLLKKDARMMANMHLTSRLDGGSTKIRIGLHFADEGVKPIESINHWTVNNTFNIPAGEPNHFVSAEWEAPYDATVFGFIPHMHLRGKDMKFTAIHTDGREELLLDSIWNNDWQLNYQPVEPYNFPKGTKIRVTGHFDNSEENELNPDPTRDVPWGLTTKDEMFIGYIDYMPQIESGSTSD